MAHDPKVGEFWAPGDAAEPPEKYRVWQVSRGRFSWWAFCAPGEKPPGPKDNFPPDRRGQERADVVRLAWVHFGVVDGGLEVTMVGSANAWVLARGAAKVVSLDHMRRGWRRVA